MRRAAQYAFVVFALLCAIPEMNAATDMLEEYWQAGAKEWNSTLHLQEPCVDTDMTYGLQCTKSNISICNLHTKRSNISKVITNLWYNACQVSNLFVANTTPSDCYNNVLLPMSGVLFMELLTAEKLLCECLGGAVTSGPLSGMVECSKDISCYMDAEACFSVDTDFLGGEFEKCQQKMLCGKHVSHARGLLLESVYRVEGSDPLMDDPSLCVEHWQKCLFFTDTCSDHTCAHRDANPMCSNREYCRLAAAPSGVLSPQLWMWLVFVLFALVA